MVPSHVPLLLLLLLLCLLRHEAGAQGGVEPKPNKPEPLRLTLHECFEKALLANLDLKVERISPLLSATEVLGAQSYFDLRFRTDAQYGETSTPRSAEQVAADGRSSINSRTTQLSGSVLQRFEPGTEFGFTTNTRNTPSTFTSFRDEWSSFAGFTLTQPLLRNFGPEPNMARIRISRSNLAASEALLQFRMEQTLTSVANAYYDLIFARDNLAAQEKALGLAQRLLSDNETRVTIGVMSPLDVSQANAEVAARKGDVIQAQRNIQAAENTLRRLIADDVTPLLQRDLIPTDLPPENWTPQPVSYEITPSLLRRADLRQALLLKDRNQLDEAFRKNQLLPQLNLRGQYGYAGLDRDLDVSYNDIADTLDQQWFAGITLEIPWQNRDARANYEAARLRRQQQELLIKRLEQEAIVQIDNAANQVDANRQSIIAARTARQLAQESLEAEEQKLQAGVTTSYIVLQLQRDLARARVNELRAIADYQKSLAELARVQGLTTQFFAIDWRP